MTTITSKVAFKNRLNRISADTVVSDLVECMTWAKGQLVEHNNATATRDIFNAIKTIAKKPKGFTAKNFLEYFEAHGLKYNKKEKTFSLQKGATKNLFETINPSFWEDLPEIPTKTKSNLEKALDAIKKLEAGEMQTLLEQLNLINMDQELAEAA